MMYRTIEDFKKDWDYESETTAKIFGKMTDASLGQRVTPGGRTLGSLAWHIVVCLGMATEAGLPFRAAAEYSSQPPSGVAAIKDTYQKSAAALIASVEKNWRDANLLEEVQMYGMTWTRGYALFAMVKHQAHHRGQMTVLMRQAGLVVPGAYGPAREEWAAIGMEAQP
jgi:uncharacterized damage-inducible protein DinB